MLLYFFRAEAETKKVFRCSSNNEKFRVFCAQGAHSTKWYRHDRMDWQTVPMPLPIELDSNEGKMNTPNLNGTDEAELNQYYYNGPFTDFEKKSDFEFKVKRDKRILL